MTFRGKKREVVAVLDSHRDAGAYRCRCRLACGHTVTVRHKSAAGYVPTVGYCNHPDCIMSEAA